MVFVFLVVVVVFLVFFLVLTDADIWDIPERSCVEGGGKRETG